MITGVTRALAADKSLSIRFPRLIETRMIKFRFSFGVLACLIWLPQMWQVEFTCVWLLASYEIDWRTASCFKFPVSSLKKKQEQKKQQMIDFRAANSQHRNTPHLKLAKDKKNVYINRKIWIERR